MKTTFSDRLTSEHIRSVITDPPEVVRIPAFIQPDTADQIADLIGASELLGSYENAPIDRVGQAYFEGQASAAASQNYAANSVRWIGQMRDELRPLLAPIDKLRLQTDEAWTAGATLATIAGTRAFSGLARKFRLGSFAEPHQDVLEWDLFGSASHRPLKAQLAANIYLRIPPTGGELVIWPRSLSREEYEAFRIPGSYGVHAEQLDCDPIVIRPEVGELIIFNSRYVHAVLKSDTADRYTSSTFIGFYSDKEPLLFWS